MSGQIVSEGLFVFETTDGFRFEAKVICQIFPVRDLNGDLQGCVLKYHMTADQKIL